MLLKADKNFILDETSTFNYDNGVSIRKGTGNCNDNTTTTNWINTIKLITFKNKPIPECIRLKAHVTQVNNARCFAAISVLIEGSIFNLIYFVDESKFIGTENSYGLFGDGYSLAESGTRDQIRVKLVSLKTGTNQIDVTQEINSNTFPRFYDFKGNAKTCDIIYHSMYYFRESGQNLGTYPFYLEKIDIQF